MSDLPRMDAELAKVTAERICEAGKVEASQPTFRGTGYRQPASIEDPKFANQAFETSPVSGRRHHGFR